MTTHNCLIIFSLIIRIRSISSSQASSYNYELRNSLIRIEKEIEAWQGSNNNIIMEPKTKLIANYSTSVERDADTEVTTNLRSWRAQSSLHHRHLRTAHGILNIIGWGTLLPVGAIIARYFRKFPMRWNEWYTFHILCQSAGYVLGTIGWLIGILARHLSSTQHTDRKSHRILDIIIFTLTTIQMLAIFWQPKNEEEQWRKRWEIYHHVVGYVLIGLIVADIFLGINNQTHATKWKWMYGVMLGVMLLIALSLEILRCFKSKIFHHTVELNSEMYTSP